MLKVNRKKLSLAVLQALSAGAIVGVVAPVANAQVQPAQTTPTTTVSAEDVQKFSTTVTGSRIPSANLNSTSPVTTVGAQDIKLEGVQNVENLLNNLPQVFADFGANESNGATGTATVNLRNLGAQRTLVLINGRRLPAGSPTYLPDRPEPDPGAADRARRNPDRRRIGGLRLGRGRGCGELHHEGQFPGRAGRSQLQRLQPPAEQWPRRRHRGARGDQPGAVPGAGQCQLRRRGTTSTSRWAATSPTTAATRPCSSTTRRTSRSCRPSATTARARPATAPTATSLVVRRLVDQLPGPFPRCGRRLGRRHDRQRAGRRAAVRRGDRPVQLRSVQLLPAPGRALWLQRVRPLRRQRACARVRRVQLPRRPHRRADRAQRHLRRQ